MVILIASQNSYAQIDYTPALPHHSDIRPCHQLFRSLRYMQASRIHHVLVVPNSIMDVRHLLHDIGRAVGNEISTEPR